ncbi:hypothetical protein ACWGIP_34005, partial [Streptomyces sp. NPDC054838]
METATSLLIGRLADYLRGLTRRLDPGAGWYGEFLRRDPEGMRACLDGAAIPPWDVLASLLLDGSAVAGEVEYAARLRDAAAAAWDRAPGGARELRELLARAAEQRAASEAALAGLTERLAATTDPAQARALTRELYWLQDDTARAEARHGDLTARLAALSPGARAGSPAPRRPDLTPGPAPRAERAAGRDDPSTPSWAGGPESRRPTPGPVAQPPEALSRLAEPRYAGPTRGPVTQ